MEHGCCAKCGRKTPVRRAIDVNPALTPGIQGRTVDALDLGLCFRCMAVLSAVAHREAGSMAIEIKAWHS